jgi:hypothetical protein
VLYGTYENGVVRILAVREIACEHARGPSFILSESDRELLEEQWERDRDDPRLSGFSALGFYVSHTRSEVTLLPADVEFFNEFFPDPYHVALVVRPGRAGAMRAGFFVREADGSVKAETSYQDFSFPERLGGPSAARHPREQAPLAEKRTTLPLGFTPSQVEPAPPPQTEFTVPNFGGLSAAPQTARAPEYMPVQPPQRRWGAWLAAILVIIAIAAGAVAYGRYFLPTAGPAEPLSLAAYQHDSQLRIEWNHNASAVRDAGKGSLEITDGQTMQTIPLTPEDLARGSFTYTPTSGDVQVRMEIQSASRGNVIEQTRFLGAPPSGASASGDVQAIKQERDSLQEEVKKLRDQNADQVERNRQLQRTLTILRSRLGIIDSDNKK